jgi:hypothetical protein
VLKQLTRRAAESFGKRRDDSTVPFARQQSLARMDSVVIVQAQAISYVEVYWLLAVASALMFLLSFLLAKNEPGAAGDVPVH